MKNGAPTEALETFAAACRAVAAHGLVRCSSGNMSQRLPDGRVLITASRTWMARMTPAQVVTCALATGEILRGGIASVEAGFHLGILRARPEVEVVLHFQSPAATALACDKRLEELNFNVLPEIPFYIGEPALVPFLQPGSDELARAVVAAARKRDLVIMRNHGLVVLGRNPDDALQKADFFELACSVLLANRGEPQAIPRSAVNALKRLGRKSRGPG